MIRAVALWTAFLFLPVLISPVSSEVFDSTPVTAFVKFKNGDCVENKGDSRIKYAISGINNSRYQLTLIKDGLPISMVMDWPIHSSVAFIGTVFKHIECNWKPEAAGVEIYESPFDWYGSLQMYSKNMF